MNGIGRVVALGAVVVACVIGVMAACGGRALDTSSTSPEVGGAGQGGSTFVTTTFTRSPADHRPVASSCVGVHAPPEPVFLTYTTGSCTRHADCTAGTNGKCINGIGSAYNHYFCVYDDCATDADCDAGSVCYCTASTSARCLSTGNCLVDGNCGGSNRYCSPSMGMDCDGYHSVDGYYCHTSTDSCIDDSDCTGTDYCNYDVYKGRWQCTPINTQCAIG